ncbi:MAG: glycosyltransferase, partial [Bacteroidota bacterium]
MSITSPELSIVIVTHDSGGTIRFCLDAISHASADLDIEIMIVDHASTDDTLALIQSTDLDLHVIPLRTNEGFAKGCHRGVMASSGEMLMLLNPDVIVSHSFLSEAISSLREGYRVGAIVPLLIDGQGRILPESARQLPSVGGSLRKLL